MAPAANAIREPLPCVTPCARNLSQRATSASGTVPVASRTNERTSSLGSARYANLSERHSAVPIPGMSSSIGFVLWECGTLMSYRGRCAPRTPRAWYELRSYQFLDLFVGVGVEPRRLQ